MTTPATRMVEALHVGGGSGRPPIMGRLVLGASTVGWDSWLGQRWMRRREGLLKEIGQAHGASGDGRHGSQILQMCY